MIKEFQYTFEELGIEKSDIEELLGFENSELPEPFPDLIEISLKHAPSICNIRGGYKLFNPTKYVLAVKTYEYAISSFTRRKSLKLNLKMQVHWLCLYLLQGLK
jgi:hypothetical protein